MELNAIASDLPETKRKIENTLVLRVKDEFRRLR